MSNSLANLGSEARNRADPNPDTSPNKARLTHPSGATSTRRERCEQPIGESKEGENTAFSRDCLGDRQRRSRGEDGDPRAFGGFPQPHRRAAFGFSRF
ncbi:hypothetical protein U1Q18_024798 [Sarracenia purpurea var. burkii]